MIDFTTEDGSKISDLTMDFSVAINALRYVLNFTKNGTVENVNYVSSVTGNNIDSFIRCGADGVTVNCYNLNHYSFGASVRTDFVRIANNGTVNIYNSSALSINKTNVNSERLIEQTNGVVNIYNSYLDATGAISAGAGVVSCEAGNCNIYNTTIKATGASTRELRQTSTGTLTVYDCTLVNNTTSGTITYAGTKRFNAVVTNSTVTVGAYTLPATDGTNGQVLVTNGSGVLTWTTL
jgi:hypothetical protein